MKIVTIDIETPRIPLEGSLSIDKIFCIGIKSGTDPTKVFTYVYHKSADGPLKAALKLINSHDVCVGHNICKFDEPVIRNLLGQITIPLADTLLDSKLMYSKDDLFAIDRGIPEMPPSLQGGYSLKAFGYRLSDNKLNFEDFSELTEEMIIYCKQDVDLTYQLYQHLISQPNYPSKAVRELEYKTAEIMCDQENHGFYFNIDGARKLATKMRFDRMNLEHKLQKVFKPKFIAKGKPVVPKSPRKNKAYEPDPYYKFKSRIPMRHIIQIRKQKNGTTKLPAKTKYKWFDTPHKLFYKYTTGEYQPLEYKRFNPGSRAHIELWLKSIYDWKPIEYSPTGRPKVDADTLTSLPYEEAKPLQEYLKLVKDLGQLIEGDNSLLTMVSQKTHRFHGSVDTLGANTFRMTHSKPNITQVPKDKAFRELLTVPPGKVFVDVDADQLELVMLGHFLGPYDNYKYAKVVDSGDKSKGTDIHTMNQIAAGLPTRDKAKTFIYGYLYGSGATRVGWGLWDDKTLDTMEFTEEDFNKARQSILNRIKMASSKGAVTVGADGIQLFPIAKDRMIPFTDTLVHQAIYGNQIIDKFRQQTEGLDQLITDTQNKAKAQQLRGLLDYQLHLRSPHSAFNLLLQSGGAIYMKQYLYEIDRELRQSYTHGKEFGYVANIHDAVNIECIPEIQEHIRDILTRGFKTASDVLGLKFPVCGQPAFGLNQHETH